MGRLCLESPKAKEIPETAAHGIIIQVIYLTAAVKFRLRPG